MKNPHHGLIQWGQKFAYIINLLKENLNSLIQISPEHLFISRAQWFNSLYKTGYKLVIYFHWPRVIIVLQKYKCWWLWSPFCEIETAPDYLLFWLRELWVKSHYGDFARFQNLRNVSAVQVWSAVWEIPCVICIYSPETGGKWDHMSRPFKRNQDHKAHPVMWYRLIAITDLILNSLWLGDAIWRQRSGSTLAQVMACCLMAPSHYLNQYWLIISEVQWHSY